MAVINTNVKALFSQMALGSSGRAQSVAMQQLSTGKRINSARDDAAGMAIATRMTQQIRSLNQAVRNAGDAISLIQTAEGATNEITDMMQRMRELAIQAVNDTNNNDQRSYLDLEFQQLKQQIVQIADQTEWNGFPVLNGSAGERVGEMPVYKVTSNNQFGDVFIDPTTTRTISGAGGGETQILTIDFKSSTAQDDGENYVSVSAGSLGTIKVKVTQSEVDEGIEAVTRKIASELNGKVPFGGNSGRSVTVKDAAAGELLFTFNASDRDIGDVSLDGGMTAVRTAVAIEERKAVTSANEVFTGNGKYLQSGSLRLSVDTANKVTASFLNTKNEITSMTGSLDAASGKVTFEVKQGLNASVISDTLTYTLLNAEGTALDLSAVPDRRAVSLNVDVAGSIPTMRAGDLIINGVIIGPSNASDDKLSPANNAAGSAIAKAAAINRMAVDQGFSQGESQSITFASNLILPGTITVGGVNIAITPDDNTPVLVAKKVALALKASPQFEPSTGRAISWAEGSTVVNINYPVTDGDVKPVEVSPGNTALVSTVRTVQNYAPNVPGTGVFAKVNENVFTGQAMQGSSVVTGRVFVNGYASADIATVLNNPRATREEVVRAINLITDRTGVKAVDTGSDEKGITLTAADGRNIEVRFETPNNAADFGQRIGLREGVQSSTISLESKIDAPVVLSSSSIGDIQRVGLDAGNYSKNQAVMNTQQRDAVQPAVAQVNTLKISGSGSLAVGESMIAVVNGVQFKVTADPGALTAKEVRAALLTKLNTDPDAAKTGVIATAGANSDEILLTAKTPGLAYTLSANKLPSTSSSSIGIVAKELVPNATANIKSLGLNDLQINGINIRATTLEDDKDSTRDVSSSDPASSAIALAAAINASSAETGVRAEPNPVTIVGGTTLTKLPAGDLEGKSKQSLWINGVEIKVDFVANESVTARVDRVVAAINEYSGPSGVKATNNGNGVTLNSDGRNVAVWFDSSVKDLSAASFGLEKGGSVAQVTKVTLGGTATAAATSTIRINGVEVQATTTSPNFDPEDMAAAMIAAINAKVADDASPLKNVIAEVSDDGKSLLVRSTVPGSAFDIRGAVFAGGDALTMAIGTVTANSSGNNDVNAIDLSDAYKDYVLGGVSNASNVKTLYGTVKLIAAAPNLPTMPGADGLKPNVVGASGRPITITTGGDGLGALSNFSALGFNEGIFGGRASTEMEPPRVGRMAFQVGSSANQIITIDLADFGKNGSITGEITGDVDRDVETRSVRINTKDGATAVLNLLDRAMDKVNATRATMGAVMNRLDHVINNLTNVSMNMSASRSQIEDSDYAAASTELAKTQIMQQAATAVLAQANTSQQSVLKLLGG